MSYLRLEHRVMSSDALLKLTPTAFTVHAYALDYCNQQADGTHPDGFIPTRIAHRLMCPAEPAEIPAAFDDLVDAGLWERVDDGYMCPGFLSYGIAGDEQAKTRARWSQDKRRQTLHGIGNHDLCLPRYCPAKKAEQGQGGTDSTPDVEQAPPKGGRSNQTRPDQTPKGFGSGMGTAATIPTPPADAGVGRPPRVWVEGFEKPLAKPTPWDIKIRQPLEWEDRHFDITVVPYLDENGIDAAQWHWDEWPTDAENDAGRAYFRTMARDLVPVLESVVERYDHRECPQTVCRVDVTYVDDEFEPMVGVYVRGLDSACRARDYVIAPRIAKWIADNPPHYPNPATRRATKENA